MLGLIVRRELADLFRSPRFVVSYVLVSLLVVLAFGLGALHHRGEVERHAAVLAEDLRQLAGESDWRLVAPALHLPPQPLASLVEGVAHDVGRNIEMAAGAVDPARDSRYGEEPLLALWRFLDLGFVFRVVLTLFAVVFTFDAVSGERERGTLRLALAHPIPRPTFVLGKLLGALLGLTVPFLVPLLAGTLLWVALGAPLGGDELARLGLVVAAGFLQVAAIVALALLVSSRTRSSASSFVVLLSLWVLLVLVLPPTATLIASRAVAVPSIDAALAAEARLRRELLREDHDALADALAKAGRGTSPVADLQARIDAVMTERQEERKRRLATLRGRLDEERRNAEARRRELVFALARLSPSATFALAAADLAGTGLALPERFAAASRAYAETFERFQREKTGGAAGALRIVVRRSDEATPEAPTARIDPRELPAFAFVPVPLAESLRDALGDLAVLALWTALFYAAAFVSFLRYDVR